MSVIAVMLREMATSLEQEDRKGNKQVAQELKGAATRFDRAVGLVARWRAKAKETGFDFTFTVVMAQLVKDLLNECAEELQNALSESPSDQAQEAANKLAEVTAQRDTAWQELRLIREKVGADENESTYDEVCRITGNLLRRSLCGVGER